MGKTFGLPPIGSFRKGYLGSIQLAGSVTILAASALAPIAGSAIDSSLKGISPFTSLPIREAVNLTAAIPAIALLVFLTSRDRRLDSVRTLAWVSGLPVLLLVVIRLGLQLTTNIISVNSNPQWIGPELLVAVMLWPILWAVMGLVAQKDRLVDVQMVLLDEARRGLKDDNEALRTRVFDHLHGTVTSELVVARVRLNDLAMETTDPRASVQIRAIASHIQRIHEFEVRRLAHVMVASGLDSGLDEAFRQLADSCEGLCDISLDLDPDYREMERQLGEDAQAALRLTIYRIVEECLSNALQHAGARHVVVTVSIDRGHERSSIDIIVSNDGLVPTDTPHFGVGMRVIRARVGAYEGTAEANVSDNRFTVRCRLHVIHKLYKTAHL